MENRKSNMLIIVGSLVILLATAFELVTEKKAISNTQILSLICVAIILISVFYQGSKK